MTGSLYCPINSTSPFFLFTTEITQTQNEIWKTYNLYFSMCSLEEKMLDILPKWLKNKLGNNAL